MRRDYYLVEKEKRQKQRSMGPEWKDMGLTIGRETKGAQERQLCGKGSFPALHAIIQKEARMGMTTIER